MTLTILVSFSLLALVVTARPIQVLTQDGPQFDAASASLQDVVQAIFQSRTSQTPECLSCQNEDDIRVQFTSAQEQDQVLSALDDLEAIKGVVPIGLDGVLTDEEKKLYDILRSPKPGAGLNDLDGGERPLSESDSSDKVDDVIESEHSMFPAFMDPLLPPQQMLVLAFSCVASLLAVGCIGLALYLFRYFRKGLGSESSWEMIPRIETRDAIEIVIDEDFVSRFGNKKADQHKASLENATGTTTIPPSEETPHEKPDLITFDSGSDSDDEDLDEKFHDAEEPPLLFLDAIDFEKRELPVILIDEPAEHPDPGFLPLPAFLPPTPYSTPPPTPPRSPYRRIAEMRELSSHRPSSPKPAWSLRASDAPVLGMTGSEARAPLVPLPLPINPRLSPAQGQQGLSSPVIPGGLPPPLLFDEEKQMLERRGGRAYRTPVPELDIAFAMQLRPGLGLGSDSAWIVRFLMTMFGWMTVLFGSGGTLAVRRREQRAIA